LYTLHFASGSGRNWYSPPNDTDTLRPGMTVNKSPDVGAADLSRWPPLAPSSGRVLP
jgi:hypothetical protein